MGVSPDKKTLKLLGSHLKFLKKTFSPVKIILFGSRARGDHVEESDIDLLLISKKFEGVPLRERMAKAYNYWDKKTDLEQICLAPKEAEKKGKQFGLVRQALKEGIIL